MRIKRSDDPDVPVRDLYAANRRHDAQKHSVTMWPRARYRGGFGYPPGTDEQVRKRRRELPQEWKAKGL